VKLDFSVLNNRIKKIISTTEKTWYFGYHRPIWCGKLNMIVSSFILKLIYFYLVTLRGWNL